MKVGVLSTGYECWEMKERSKVTEKTGLKICTIFMCA